MTTKKFNFQPLNKLSAIAFISLTLALASCSSNDENSIVISSDDDHQMHNEITITKAQFEANEMSLTQLTQNPFVTKVLVNGMFDVPPQNRASVSTYYGGYVKEVHFLPGEDVRKGEVLFTLENPEFVKIQEEFLDAKGQLSFLASDYERQKSLASDHVTSEKKFLQAEADYNSTTVKYASLKKKLALMNIDYEKLDASNLTTTIAITAPISGSITGININKGMFVQPSNIAVSIINKEHMHLELKVFEQDLVHIKVGQPINFNLQNGEKVHYDAHVYLINKSMDYDKRTIDIHGHLDDEKMLNRFIPGMYIEAEIMTSSDTALALPVNAVGELDDKHYVLLQTSDSNDQMTFEQREVSIGKTSTGFVGINNHMDFGRDAIFLLEGAYHLIQKNEPSMHSH